MLSWARRREESQFLRGKAARLSLRPNAHQLGPCASTCREHRQHITGHLNADVIPLIAMLIQLPGVHRAWSWQQQRRHVSCQSSPTSGSGSSAKGKCFMVGSGPGPPDLLTVRAVELIKSAEVIVYDDLGTEGAVSLYAPPTAERVYVGKRGQRESIKQASIDEILVQHALQGKRVVRLKGGCPSVFARLHSELAALAEAGIPVEVVPGVSSALAAPLAAGFPLTHPELSRGFHVASAHDPDSLDWPTLAAADTLVLLMGGNTLGVIMQRLKEAGKAADTPVAVIRNATLPSQRVWKGTVSSIPADTQGEKLSPCIVVVGHVTGIANR